MYSIEEFDKEKTKVMNYIMYKKRTEKEVKNKFQNTCAHDLLCDIIDYVKEAGYLDDKDYIKKAINEFMALKNLSQKELLEDYFYEHKEELKEYEKKSAQNISIKKQTILQKEEIANYLVKKGYKEEIIKEVL